MKKIIGLILVLAIFGCSKQLSDEAKQNCQQFAEQMDSYIMLMRDDPANAQSNFEPVHSSWIKIRDSIPSCAQKKRIDNTLNLHQLALMNVSLITLYVPTSDGMEVPEDRLQQWKTNCQQIHQKIDKKYFKYMRGKIEGLNHPKEVKNILEEFLTSPTAMCPSNRLLGNPQINNEIVTMNLNECTEALNQLIK